MFDLISHAVDDWFLGVELSFSSRLFFIAEKVHLIDDICQQLLIKALSLVQSTKSEPCLKGRRVPDHDFHLFVLERHQEGHFMRILGSIAIQTLDRNP